MRHTRKLPCLPAVARDLRGIGYRTMAVHGGDLVIMHKSDFYLSAGNTRLMAQRDFPGTGNGASMTFPSLSELPMKQPG